MFKPGDLVRRKPGILDDRWPHQDGVVTVEHASDTLLVFREVPFTWNACKFELVKHARPPLQTITTYKVGPYNVTVFRRTDLPLLEAYEEANHTLSDVNHVLAECDYDYRDPEMSHEDMLERLVDRLSEVSGVTEVHIVGVGGDGVRFCVEG